MRQEQIEEEPKNIPQLIKRHATQPQKTHPFKNNLQKTRSIQTAFNLLDFVIEKGTQQKHSKQPSDRTPTKKPLRTEPVKKKPPSHLRKQILFHRDLKNNHLHLPTTDETLETSLASLDITKKEKPVIHSRNFRSYCENTTSEKLENLTEKLLQDMFKFQARLYEKNPIKGRAHRRYVLGFKESLRQLAIDKVKLIIIATDCEPCDLVGGPDEQINKIKSKCKENEIPYAFALKRRRLSYVLFKKVTVSCVAVLNYEGAQDTYRELLECLDVERTKYGTLAESVL